MSRPYDASLKHLLDQFGPDWVGWLGPRLGLPAGAAADPLDVDLSVVQAAADRVFRLRPPHTGLLHLEPQASWDGDLPDRLHLYHTLLHHRYDGPVYTVAVLLRREANSPGLTGVLSRRYPDGREYLRFEYAVIRVWTLPVEPLLTAGLGVAPLALLTDEAEGRLSELLTRIDRRCETEGLPPGVRDGLLTAGYLLLGMRYDEDTIHTAFTGVRGMKESVTYQAILREGRQEGRQEGQLEERRQSILAILSERFETVPPEVAARVNAATDLDRLAAAVRQAVRVADPNELQL